MRKKTKTPSTGTRQRSPRRSPLCAKLTRLHCAATALAVALITAGFIMMLPERDVRNAPGGRFAPTPGPGAFEAIRIRAAPLTCLIGYLLIVPTILYTPRNEKSDAESASEA